MPEPTVREPEDDGAYCHALLPADRSQGGSAAHCKRTPGHPPPHIGPSWHTW